MYILYLIFGIFIRIIVHSAPSINIGNMMDTKNPMAMVSMDSETEPKLTCLEIRKLYLS